MSVTIMLIPWLISYARLKIALKTLPCHLIVANVEKKTASPTVQIEFLVNAAFTFVLQMDWIPPGEQRVAIFADVLE